MGPTLAGDRWVEWSFCFARLADGPGRTLDFGADIGFLSIAAAQRGHDVVALDRVQIDLATATSASSFGTPTSSTVHSRVSASTRSSTAPRSSTSGSPGATTVRDVPDGDLEAMTIMREALGPVAEWS